eukprot:3049173-Pleurochrysis_carterae.AAC.1
MKTNVLICSCLLRAADIGKLVEAGVLALRARLGLLLDGEAEKYNDDDDFLWTVNLMVETKKAACDPERALLFVAGALSSQELQERVGA